MNSKENINVSLDWLTNTLKEYMDDVSEWRHKATTLEMEVKELREMREKIIQALGSIHEEDSHGNIKAYKYDDALSRIRRAVYPTTTDDGWTYSFPFDRQVKQDLDNLRLVK